MNEKEDIYGNLSSMNLLLQKIVNDNTGDDEVVMSNGLGYNSQFGTFSPNTEPYWRKPDTGLVISGSGTMTDFASDGVCIGSYTNGISIKTISAGAYDDLSLNVLKDPVESLDDWYRVSKRHTSNIKFTF